MLQRNEEKKLKDIQNIKTEKSLKLNLKRMWLHIGKKTELTIKFQSEKVAIWNNDIGYQTKQWLTSTKEKCLLFYVD